jgi:medium-chain acyl-[acyl-carrier-protein] hydrolase
MRAKHRDCFRVRSYETDLQGRLQAPILCKWLEEAAVNHAEILGVAVETLFEHGVAWVLSRLQLIVERWPANGEEIVVKTWPEAASRLFTERRFEVFDASETRIGAVSTLWLVLDLVRRRPIRFPPLVLDRLAAIDIGTELRGFTDLDAINTAQNELAYTVRRSDLDLADHVNNTSYVEWAVEAVPDEVWSTHDLTCLEIQYLSECHHGQTILSRSRLVDHDDEIKVNHQLVRKEDGAEVARALTRWRTRSGQR